MFGWKDATFDLKRHGSIGNVPLSQTFLELQDCLEVSQQNLSMTGNGHLDQLVWFESWFALESGQLVDPRSNQ